MSEAACVLRTGALVWLPSALGQCHTNSRWVEPMHHPRQGGVRGRGSNLERSFHSAQAEFVRTIPLTISRRSSLPFEFRGRAAAAWKARGRL